MLFMQKQKLFFPVFAQPFGRLDIPETPFAAVTFEGHLGSGFAVEDDDFDLFGISCHFEKVQRERLETVAFETDAPAFVPVLENTFFVHLIGEESLFIAVILADLVAEFVEILQDFGVFAHFKAENG